MENKQLNDLQEIRNLMEKSSRFLSLSGLSGVSAGIIALIGAGVAFFYFDFHTRYFNLNNYFITRSYFKWQSGIKFLLLDGFAVLVLALASGIYFTVRRARKKGYKIWDSTTKRLIVNLSIPLFAGGVFCLILLSYGIIFLVAPATLIFYGLALLNASKYTLPDIRYLGISEIMLGLTGSFFIGYGLLVWAIGFGILHIAYGSFMYWKYDSDVQDINNYRQ